MSFDKIKQKTLKNIENSFYGTSLNLFSKYSYKENGENSENSSKHTWKFGKLIL